MEEISSWEWIAFFSILTIGTLIDLKIEKKGDYHIYSSPIFWTIIWMAFGLLFAVYVYYVHGQRMALEYITAFLVEKSLSVDNIFTFILVLDYFKIQDRYQAKVLLSGIIISIALRILFIIVGIELTRKFEWAFLIFGFILIYSGGTFLKEGIDVLKGKNKDKNKVIIPNFLIKRLRVLQDYGGSSWIVKHQGKFYITNYMLAFIGIFISDVVFAVDSVPAVLAITESKFIAITSNIAAVMGLRALYGVIVDFLRKIKYLHFALSFILVFIGVKLIISMFGYSIPHLVSLSFIVFLLLLATVLSFVVSGFNNKNRV